MFRLKLPYFQGMLFKWETPKHITMWMKNTYISLDMLWLDQSLTIVDYKSNTEILSEKHLSSPHKASYVLELNAGLIDRYNMKKGDRFYWQE